MSKTPKAYLILEFRNDDEKNRFVGGLLDGWGEGAPISVDWDSGKSDKDGICDVHAGIAPLLRVKVLKEGDDV
jgi:hypothetical protein